MAASTALAEQMPSSTRRKRFGQHGGALQAIDHEAVNLAPEDDRRLPDPAHQAFRLCHDGRFGPGRGHDLDERNEVRRINRVSYDTPPAPLSPSVKAEAGRPEVELATMA